jgi:hypothetical protein
VVEALVCVNAAPFAAVCVQFSLGHTAVVVQSILAERVAFACSPPFISPPQASQTVQSSSQSQVPGAQVMVMVRVAEVKGIRTSSTLLALFSDAPPSFTTISDEPVERVLNVNLKRLPVPSLSDIPSCQETKPKPFMLAFVMAVAFIEPKLKPDKTEPARLELAVNSSIVLSNSIRN